ncbi:MAG TPA: carboxylating nicotinate-nucleotide diphosphorylase [Candidatus Krumholzibacteria bacterium]|nr:carboxylating nicotinate-nucleotide diphosphorylase [Candidatus Krumholzibacteria bacterium]
MTAPHGEAQPLDAALVASRVAAALSEDAAGHDATNAFLALGDESARAEIRVASATVACGVDVAREVFFQVDARIRFDAHTRDGAHLEAGARVCGLAGPARSLLSGERTALNFLQRLCGVATLASRFVAAVGGTGVVILDTRKTTPLWRDLEKYAVRCGGARNHRHDLGAMILVKDNHVRAIGGRSALVARIAQSPRAPFVEVEVDSLEFLRELLASPAARNVDRLMLDNFTPERVAEAMADVVAYRARGARLEVEVSGGVTLDTVRAFAQAGVDFISVGALTHSAIAAPMSLEFL